MRSRRLLSGGLGLLLAIVPALAALVPGPARGEYSRRVWRVQDGLPQNRIQAISQTADGYLWIGTPGGLARFDGVRFVVFSRSNTPELRDDSILSLCPAKDGSLWIGTEGGGLLRYSKGSFQGVGAEQGLTNGFVRAVREDRHGVLWVGTDRGLFRSEGGKFARLDGRGGVPLMSVLDIREGREDRLWIGYSGGIAVVEDGNPRPMPAAGQSPLLVGLRIMETRAGEVYMGTHAGLFLLRSGRLEPRSGLQGMSVQALLEDSEGNIWAGSLSKGLVRSQGARITEYAAPDPLPDGTVQALFEDRQHSLWVGTLDGLVRLSRRTVSLLGSGDGLSDDNIVGISSDTDGGMWLTTITGQLYRAKDGHVDRFQLPAPDFGARTVLRDSRGDLWFGSYNRGIVRLSAKGVTTYTRLDGLRTNSIRQFFEDKAGIIWIATGSGLSRWDGQALKTYYLEDGLAYGSVRVIAQDRQGDLLVGTDGGANRLRGGKFIKDPLLTQIGIERVWAILEDSDGGLWLGTRGGGLFRVKSGKVTRYTTRDGLLSDSVFQLLEDRRGRLWMTGPAGISSADLGDLNALAEQGRGPVVVTPFGFAEGLESSQLNGGIQPAGSKASGREFWFPSVKGVVRVDPEELRTTPPAPVLLESVLVDDRPFPLSGEIRIPSGRGRLEIHYTACDLLSPERITFKYMLEGFDQGWTTATMRRAAYYTNLPPGAYRFRVATVHSAAPAVPSEASLSFVWEPRFLETGWFFGLCALIAAASVWAGFRLYARQTAARYSALLGERVRLAREMHDTVIQGCVGVSTLLEAASSLSPSETAKRGELLDQARSQVRLTLDEARQAVWDLRGGSLDGSLAKALGDFAASLSLQKGVPVQTEVLGDQVPLEGRVGRNLLLVAREALRNAVAHGAPGRIKVLLAFDPGRVRLEIVDDGRGFDPSAVGSTNGGHYGIEGMRERVVQLGGSFRVRSSPGQGASVIAQVPITPHVREDAPMEVSLEQGR